MNILADEGIDGPIVTHLRQVGHFVHYVAEMAPGISDEAVLDLANQAAVLLITADKDFGELLNAFSVVTSKAVRIRRRKS